MHVGLCLLSVEILGTVHLHLSLIVCRNSWNALTSLSFVCRNSWNCALTSLSLIVCRNSWNALTSLSFVCRNSWNCALTPHLYVCLLSVEILGTVHLCLLSFVCRNSWNCGLCAFWWHCSFQNVCWRKRKSCFPDGKISVLILLFFFVWGNQGWWPFRVNSGVGAQVFFWCWERIPTI